MLCAHIFGKLVITSAARFHHMFFRQSHQVPLHYNSTSNTVFLTSKTHTSCFIFFIISTSCWRAGSLLPHADFDNLAAASWNDHARPLHVLSHFCKTSFPKTFCERQLLRHFFCLKHVACPITTSSLK